MLISAVYATKRDTTPTFNGRMVSYDCKSCGNHTVVQSKLGSPRCIHCGSDQVERNAGMKNTREGARLTKLLSAGKDTKDLARLDCPKCKTSSVLHIHTAGRLAVNATEGKMHCPSCATELKFNVTSLFDRDTSPLDEELEDIMLEDEDIESEDHDENIMDEDEDEESLEQEDLHDDLELEEGEAVVSKKNQKLAASLSKGLKKNLKKAEAELDPDFEDDEEEVLEDETYEGGDDLGGTDDDVFDEADDELEDELGLAGSEENTAGLLKVPLYSCLDTEITASNIEFMQLESNVYCMVGDSCIASKAVENEVQVKQSTGALLKALNNGSSIRKALSVSEFKPSFVHISHDQAMKSELEEQRAENQDTLDEELSKVNQSLEQVLGIAACGINRGWFTEGAGNPIASTLANQIEAATDLTINEASEMVASVFDECGDDYVDMVRAKALELMDASEEVRNELVSSIMAETHANSIKPVSIQSSTLASRLSNPMRVSKATGLAKKADVKVLNGDVESMIRATASRSATFSNSQNA